MKGKVMRKVLIMPIGIPGSGKSTYMRELGIKFLIPIVSSDKVREILYGDESIQGNSNKVFNEVYRRVNNYLREEHCCILDATNVKWTTREVARDRARADEYVYILMKTDFEECKKRNAARERVVPEYVLDEMYWNFRQDSPLLMPEKYNKHIHIFWENDPALDDYLEKVLWEL